MINSRKTEDLAPHVESLAKDLIAACKEHGIDIIITSTYRDYESQQSLYNQGRTTPGKIVTNAKPGSSYHNFRVAFDVVPVVGGKAVWNDKGLWGRIGGIGESIGLEWAGRWKTFKESAHFQYANNRTLAQFRAEQCAEAQHNKTR